MNPLLNLINKQPDDDKIYLHAKNPYETKYQFLVNKRERIGLKHFNDTKTFIGFQLICKMFTKSIIQVKSVKYYDIDDVIADMINNKKTKFSSD